MISVYVAGKVSKDSVFGTHYWRDTFCQKLAVLSGEKIENLDPTKLKVSSQNDARQVFGGCCASIASADVVIVYLSNDISIGGSQEILIAKYFKIPVIGLAPHGGKFNGASKEYFGKIISDYKDPFVFTTCDVVCKTIEEVAEALKDLANIIPKSLDIIPQTMRYFKDSQRTNT
jgi:hypothetical protein